MKKNYLFAGILTAGLCQTASAQQKAADKSSADKQNMTVTTSQQPFYPKGEQALYNYVMYNTKYPAEAIKLYVEGTVTLSFDVMPDSSVSNAKVMTDAGYGIGAEVKKLVEKLKFAPGIQMGFPVRMNVMADFPVKAH